MRDYRTCSAMRVSFLMVIVLGTESLNSDYNKYLFHRFLSILDFCTDFLEMKKSDLDMCYI